MKRLFQYLLHIKKLNKAHFAFALLVCMFLQPIIANAQSRAELERRRKEKEKEIALTRKLLAETSKQKKQTLEYLQVLNKQIKSREELIGTLQNELHVITLSITEGNDIVSALEGDLAALRQEYNKLVYYTYKNRSAFNMITFVLTSNSFNQAYKRIQFIRFYTEYRKKQINLILKTEEYLNAKVADLKIKQALKAEVLNELGLQKENLVKDKDEQSKLARKLQGDEKKLRKQLKQKQQIAAKLDKAIREIIAKEIKANTKKTKPNATGKEKPDFGLTPETIKLSNEFAQNRSKLPWPVERGVISEHFGRQNHPTIPDVVVNNSGVKIRTTKGAKARCVFGGEVTNIVTISGANKAVIVKHGNYFTVYNNLQTVFVKPGDKISTKQEIGTVAENIINGEAEIELQIWNGQQKLNPETWLNR